MCVAFLLFVCVCVLGCLDEVCCVCCLFVFVVVACVCVPFLLVFVWRLFVRGSNNVSCVMIACACTCLCVCFVRVVVVLLVSYFFFLTSIVRLLCCFVEFGVCVGRAVWFI